jgi:hypothetical protein
MCSMNDKHTTDRPAARDDAEPSRLFGWFKTEFYPEITCTRDATPRATTNRCPLLWHTPARGKVTLATAGLLAHGS